MQLETVANIQSTDGVEAKKQKLETEVNPAPAPAKPILKFHKLTDNAFTPILGSSESAGYDLHAAYDQTIKVGERKLIKTDLQIALPDNTYGRIAPRSGLAYKHGIDVMAGVIDKDYRGNVGVLLVNLDFMNQKDFEVKKGDRIAQLVIEQCVLNTDLVECVNGCDDTDRGEGGFGSTGKN